MDHARIASQDLPYCMDSFILPARVREARNLAFSRKHPATLIGQLQQAKLPWEVVWTESQSLHTLAVTVRKLTLYTIMPLKFKVHLNTQKKCATIHVFGLQHQRTPSLNNQLKTSTKFFFHLVSIMKPRITAQEIFDSLVPWNCGKMVTTMWL